MAVEILDRLCLPVMAIADQSVNGTVGDPAIVTIGDGTGVTARVNCLFATPAAFPLSVRHHGSGHDYRWCAGNDATVLAVVRRAGS